MSVQAGGVGDSGWLIDTANDTILVTAASSQVGESLTINYRFIRKDTGAAIVDSQILSLAAGDRSIHQIMYAFQGNPRFEGLCQNDVYLTDVSIQALVATTRGQTFARVNLVRQSQGANASTAPTKCAILSDYVTQQVSACLRNARHFTSIEGPGWNRVVTQAAPAVGTQLIVRVPANARWRVQSGALTLATSNAVPARQMGVSIYPDNVNFTFSVICPNSQGASLTGNYSIAPLGLFSPAADPTQILPIPPEMFLPPLGAIVFSPAGMDVADQISILYLHVEEWLDNA